MKKNRGLKGNSGFIAPGLHIAAPYDCNGKVFVKVEDEESGTTWKRMTLTQANKEGLHVITCSMCSKPATSLDHYFPYYIDRNRCDEHLNDKSW